MTHLIEEASAVVLVKYTGETPEMIFHGLHVLNVDNQDISWFRSLNFEWSRQVVDLCQIHILDILRIVCVLDLATSPVDAFYLHSFAILDGAHEGNCLSVCAPEQWVLKTYYQGAIDSDAFVSIC
jgi:hypothetical protein